MELSHKTTLLLSPALYRRLTAVARQQGVSMGEVIRRAVEDRYGRGPTTEERLAAVAVLASLRGPVDDTATMKRESVPGPEDLLP